jgi:hypothetical protein
MTDKELHVHFKDEDQIEDLEYEVLSEEECHMLWEVFPQEHCVQDSVDESTFKQDYPSLVDCTDSNTTGSDWTINPYSPCSWETWDSDQVADDRKYSFSPEVGFIYPKYAARGMLPELLSPITSPAYPPLKVHEPSRKERAMLALEGCCDKDPDVPRVITRGVEWDYDLGRPVYPMIWDKPDK